ncbi:hypothetical protein [Mucilaginibacter terrae]|uniref:Uncharacterized protein n=1 Tax=Mucilaginibacter terrae TaxID=1955052 RepID=A0ABU3GUT5_9SPHI|nr:hypothetical protein [Mucilaginibacter terrae]MDT3403546.1 hypothetical protein [Mucilaginibacter terrae]
MTSLTPIQKLDAVLDFISKRDLIDVHEMANKINVDYNECFEILERLKDDKNIKPNSKQGNSLEPAYTWYSITFDGRLLNQTGGYKGKFDRENKFNPLQKLKVGLLNAAAVIAGLYYLLEIIRIYIAPLFPHFLFWQKN